MTILASRAKADDKYKMGIKFDPRKAMSTSDALSIFDQLAVVDIDFMLGKWKGASINTNHPLDGTLEVANWHGKHFISPENVHPLVHNTLSGKFFSVQPALMPLSLLVRFPALKKIINKRAFLFFRFLFKTKKSTARLRMLEFRGKVSATMIYDRKPINDVFRKLDDNTVLGVMDLKGVDQPFFFTLMRE